MTKEEKQKAIDALKISVPIKALTQEEFNDYIQTLNKIMDWLEREPTTKNNLGVDCISRQAVIDMTGLSEWFDSSDSYNEFVIALSEMPSVTPQEPRWIPVTEKLPEEKTAVLLSCDDMYLAKLNPCIGWISGNNWYTFSARGSYLVKYPIAWMPLPEPYKAESEET